MKSLYIYGRCIPAAGSTGAVGPASPLQRYARWLGRQPNPDITTEVELVLQVPH